MQKTNNILILDFGLRWTDHTSEKSYQTYNRFIAAEQTRVDKEIH